MEDRNGANSSPSAGIRPWFLTIFLIIIVIFTCYKIYTLIQVLINYHRLSSLRLIVSPLYLVLRSMFWIIGGGLFTWSIWSSKSWTPTSGTAVIILYAIHFWIERIFITEPSALHRPIAYNLILTLLGLGGALWILHHPQSRRYFGRNPVKIP